MTSLVRNRGLAEYFDASPLKPAVGIYDRSIVGLDAHRQNWRWSGGRNPSCIRQFNASVYLRCEGNCDLVWSMAGGAGVNLVRDGSVDVSYSVRQVLIARLSTRTPQYELVDRPMRAIVDLFVDGILIDRLFFEITPDGGEFNEANFASLTAGRPEVSDSALVDLDDDDDREILPDPTRLAQGAFRPIDLPPVGQGHTMATHNPAAISAYQSTKFYVSNRQFMFNSNTGQIASVNRPGSQWMGEFVLPPLNAAQYQEWSAFIDQLHGQAGTFIVSDPDRPNPLGSLALEPGQPEPPPRPVIDEVLDNQTIVIAMSQPIPDTLDTQYWTLTENYLLPGDYLNLTLPNGVTFLHKITRTALSTENTRLICSLVPSLQIFNIQPDQFSLHLDNPATAARLLTSAPSFTRGNDGLWTFRFQWVESVAQYTRTE